MEPVISLVICVYNRAHLIVECLESLLHQDTSCVEIMVIDDGSSDQTAEVLNRYRERVIIFTQNNRGPGAARNAGIRQATGEYVFFLDSDDFWLPWSIERFIEAISQAQRPAFILSSGTRFSNSSERSLPDQSALAFRQFARLGDSYLAFRPHPWFPSGVGIRRDVLLSCSGFTERQVNAEDIDLWFRLGDCGPVVFIDAPVMFERRDHTEQLSAHSSKAFWGCMLLFVSELSGRYPGWSYRSKRIVMMLHIFKHYSRMLLAEERLVLANLLLGCRALLLLSSPEARRLLPQGRVSPAGIDNLG